MCPERGTMTYATRDPTDDDIESRLVAVPADGWTRLWEAVDDLGDGSDLMRWAGGGQDGTTMATGDGAPLGQMPYVVYSEPVNRVVGQLYDLGLVVSFNWPDWDGARRYQGGEGLTEAPVADAVRLITAVVRADRFCDGTIGVAIEEGTLPAALRRVRAWNECGRGPG